MIRVRFDTGLVLQYNEVKFLWRGAHYTDCRKREGGDLVAQVPNSCVIEYDAPCAVFRQEGTDPAIGRVEALVRRVIRLQRSNRELRRKVKGKR